MGIIRSSRSSPIAFGGGRFAREPDPPLRANSDGILDITHEYEQTVGLDNSGFLVVSKDVANLLEICNSPSISKHLLSRTSKIKANSRTTGWPEKPGMDSLIK